MHDVLIPVWLHKEDAAKDAAGKALRAVLPASEFSFTTHANWFSSHYDQVALPSHALLHARALHMDMDMCMHMYM